MKNIPAEWRKIIWAVVPMYLFANIYLFATGEGISTLALMFARSLYLVLIAWIVVRVTKPMPPEETAAPKSKSLLWTQIGIIMSIVLFTSLNAENIPIWSGIVRWFFDLGERILPADWFGGPGNSVANPVQYFVIPFILLLTLGARPAQLGFGKGNKVWQACLAWIALPALAWIALLAMGLLPFQVFARRIISNAFQNGFFEEFLFRGALQTRLGCIMANPWALTLQALVFGIWHLRANTQMVGGDLLAGLAFCIISQSVSGFIFGLVYQRTRNLIAPSVAHVVMNAFGQTF